MLCVYFLLFTMFVVFSFSFSDDVLIEENVQVLILVFFSRSILKIVRCVNRCKINLKNIKAGLKQLSLGFC